jgi:hypothetical protein
VGLEFLLGVSEAFVCSMSALQEKIFLLLYEPLAANVDILEIKTVSLYNIL